jgi:hypothetical protein
MMVSSNLVATGAAARMFPDLERWTPEPPPPSEAAAEEALFRLSQNLFRPVPVDNPLVPAGYTYLAQFVNHDLSAGALAPSVSAVQAPSTRGGPPALDLHCIYGRGPDLQPQFYDADDPRKLRVGASQAGELDLPRVDVPDGALSRAAHFERLRPALIPDQRNDQHIIIAQLHLAFIRFHNACLDEGLTFEEARRRTRWHYQWMVINDLLRGRLCGTEAVEQALLAAAGGSPIARLPLEFSMAAFRVGHGMPRSSYHLNDELDQLRSGVPLQLFLDFALNNSLEGGRELPKGWSVQWDRFVEFKGSSPQHSTRIGAGLAGPLRWLPLPESNLRLRSLPFRTLLAGWRMDLPSGQRVAQQLGLEALPGNDPLWAYVLREAQEIHAGTRLGPVAARIVAEVIVRVLLQDPTSYLSQTDWHPDGTSDKAGDFTLSDFLEQSGAPMTAGA